MSLSQGPQVNRVDDPPIPCNCEYLATDPFSGNVSVVTRPCTGTTMGGVPNCTCCKFGMANLAQLPTRR